MTLIVTNSQTIALTENIAQSYIKEISYRSNVLVLLPTFNK